MSIRTLSAAVTIALSIPVMTAANGHKKHHNHGAYGQSGSRIVVSCYRGPWKEVIWDRPNAVFVDSLASVGYDYPTAQAIATRICRDDALVGNPEALKATMRRI